MVRARDIIIITNILYLLILFARVGISSVVFLSYRCISVNPSQLVVLEKLPYIYDFFSWVVGLE